MNIFIISWEGKYEKAKHISDNLSYLNDKLYVIYSNNSGMDETGSGNWIKVSNEFYFGMKFKIALDSNDDESMLIIHADAETDNWRDLVVSSENADNDTEIGVWAPDIDYTPWQTNIVTVSDNKEIGISFVTQTDGIILFLSSKVVKRLKLMSYDNNNLGWGIDWAAICFSYVNNLLVIRDNKLKVTHKKGAGYDSSEANYQMINFLNENLTSQEKLMYHLLNSAIILNRNKIDNED